MFAYLVTVTHLGENQILFNIFTFEFHVNHTQIVSSSINSFD